MPYVHCFVLQSEWAHLTGSKADKVDQIVDRELDRITNGEARTSRSSRHQHVPTTALRDKQYALEVCS